MHLIHTVNARQQETDF